MKIHQTAIIDKQAKIFEGVEIGPYCTVGKNVKLQKGVKLHSHVCIDGFTSIDEGTEIYPFASIGYQPQDLKYEGEESALEIGKNNVIREHVTIHKGTKLGGMKTIVGDNCLFMVGAHIAHDCIVGNNVIMANNATLGGHVEVGDHAIIGGLAAVHQHVRIGAHSIIGGVSAVVKDVIPYGSAAGDRAALIGINLVGMKRKKLLSDDINAVRAAYNMIFANNDTNFDERLKSASAELSHSFQAMEIINFLKASSKRNICMPKK